MGILLVLFFPLGVWPPLHGAKARLLASRSGVQAVTLVGRFICSVTYFLGCLDRRVAQSPQQSSEILSREPPLERPGDGFIMPLKSQ